MGSYYENLAKTIRTELYPKGVKIDIMQQHARNAEFRNEYYKKHARKKKAVATIEAEEKEEDDDAEG